MLDEQRGQMSKNQNDKKNTIYYSKWNVSTSRKGFELDQTYH